MVKELKILTFNVNGLKAILKKKIIIDNEESDDNTFENFIAESDYDIVCLNEIKMNCKKDKLLEEILPEYPWKFWNYCKSANGRHGVAIFSKYDPISVVDTLIEDKRGDGRFVLLEFESFFLVAVYVPNSGTRGLKALDFRTNVWDPALIEKLNELKEKKDVILVGDLNVVQLETDSYNFAKQRNKVAGTTDSERERLSELLSNGFVNVFREKHPKKIQYSYFSYLFPARKHNKGMLLDYFIVSENLYKKVKDIKILDNIYGSDHLPIEITLKNIKI